MQGLSLSAQHMRKTKGVSVAQRYGMRLTRQEPMVYEPRLVCGGWHEDSYIIQENGEI